MFTGIIEEVGTVAAVQDLGGGRRITIHARMAPELRPDESISVNGACQTVVRVESDEAPRRARAAASEPPAPAGASEPDIPADAPSPRAPAAASEPHIPADASEPHIPADASGLPPHAPVAESARRVRGVFEVVAVEETLRKTTLGMLEPGMPVNLERAMRPTGRLDGHIVQGHVDATGIVLAAEKERTNWLFRVRFAEEFAPYVIPVGSITIDGISLTVARLHDQELTVAIIPHTYEHTNVRTWEAGRTVNLEFDMIGKYVVRYMALRRG